MTRCILHADMDAFYAAIEQRDQPSLRGKPVIVGGEGPRSVVATASYEARKWGVHSAMPSVIAKRKCPQAVFVPPRMDVYAAVARQVFAIYARYTPLLEPLSLDEAFLDVTGSELLFGPGADIAHRIQDEVWQTTQLTVSVGVAASKYVAKVASDLRKPRGVVVVAPGTEREFLAPLSVRALWGVGPATAEQFGQLGLTTIGAIQALSLEQCIQLFGAHLGNHVHQLAHGVDLRSVEPSQMPKSVSREITFETDLVGREPARAIILEFCDDLAAQLRALELAAHTVRIKVRTPGFETMLRQERLGCASQVDLDFHHVATALFARHWPEHDPVRLLGVAATDLSPAVGAKQHGLFATPRRDQDLMTALDRIRNRFGAKAIRRAASAGADLDQGHLRLPPVREVRPRAAQEPAQDSRDGEDT